MSEIIIPRDLGGEVFAPASKSYAHRMYICAALSKEPSRIVCGNSCDDIMSTVRCLEALGARFDGDTVFPIDRSAIPDFPTLNCGESASTLRFLLPIVAALGCGGKFELSDGLSKRPIDALTQELSRHGVCFVDRKLHGKLNGNEFSIRGDISSQFISGLLMALPLIGGGIVNITAELQSAKYVDITIDCLREAGIYVNRNGNSFEVSGDYALSGTHVVECDWSAAAFWLCAGAIGKYPVSVTGLNPTSLQGDREIVNILREFGASAEFSADNSAVCVSPAPLHGIAIDASQIPDLIPVLSVVCAAAEGESRIYNAGRLRGKESDRLHAIFVMLTALDADVTELPDGLIIRGGKKLRGGKVSSFSDHRISMSAAITSSICDGEIEIDDFDCVKKSYPDFKRDFISLGGEIHE